MYRSFTDRVLGGVCGGLGALLPVGAWPLRFLFALLSIITLGAYGLLYLALWMAIPQESLLVRRRRGAGWLLLIIIAVLLTGAGWLVWATSGVTWYWPALLLVVSLVFFLRQLRG